MRPGRLAELGGAYVTFVYRPGVVVTNATSRVPSNVPALAGLIHVNSLMYNTNGTSVLTNYGLRGVATLTGSPQVALADYRTLRYRPSTSVKKTFVIIARTAALGYTGVYKPFNL